MRTLLFILCLCIGTLVNAQVNTQIVNNSALPEKIPYKGKPVMAIKFQDNTGNYIAITTQTGKQSQKGDDDFKQAHLYGYLYQLRDNNVPILAWQLHDMVTECNLDIVANFIPGSLTITDLDKNGKAEVWMVYRLSCRGDISPSDLKIIMHEGMTKYVEKGIGKIKVGKVTQHDGGIITSYGFKKAPISFKQYAGKLWDKYVQETI